MRCIPSVHVSVYVIICQSVYVSSWLLIPERKFIFCVHVHHTRCRSLIGTNVLVHTHSTHSADTHVISFTVYMVTGRQNCGSRNCAPDFFVGHLVYVYPVSTHHLFFAGEHVFLAFFTTSLDRYRQRPIFKILSDKRLLQLWQPLDKIYGNNYKMNSGPMIQYKIHAIKCTIHSPHYKMYNKTH